MCLRRVCKIKKFFESCYTYSGSLTTPLLLPKGRADHATLPMRCRGNDIMRAVRMRMFSRLYSASFHGATPMHPCMNLGHISIFYKRNMRHECHAPDYFPRAQIVLSQWRRKQKRRTDGFTGHPDLNPSGLRGEEAKSRLPTNAG